MPRNHWPTLSAICAAILLLAAPGIALAQPGAQAGPTDLPPKIWLPIALRYTGWDYPRVGMNVTHPDMQAGRFVVSGLPNYWYQDWTLRCDAAVGADHRHAMTVWGRDQIAELITGTATVPATVKSPCNDGRPLFLFNEANSCTNYSACIRAEEAVVVLEQVLAAGWHGPIYVGGLNVVGPSAHNWTLALVDQWRRRHGTLVIPGIAGWHLHFFADHFAGPYGGATNITVANAAPIAHSAVWGQTGSLESYIQARRAEGNATAIVITEHGWLQNSIDDFGGAAHEAEAAALLKAFSQEFATVPEVQGWAWYAENVPRITQDPAKDPVNYCVWCFDVGTLSASAGGGDLLLTQVGVEWQNQVRQLNGTLPAAPAAGH